MIRNQRGVAGIEVLLLITVAVLLGFVAVKTYDARHNSVAVQTAAPAKSATPYKNTQELNTAQTQLDTTNLDDSVGGSDATDLDKDLATF